MEILGVIIAFIQLAISLISLLKLEIIFLPILACELLGASGAVTGTVASIACVAWLVTIFKSVFLKK